MSDDLCEVCITAPELDWLTDFTSRLVTSRLAACGHITGPIRSIYRWQGAVHDETEARVALHTRRTLVDDIVAATKQAHPYEVPAIFVLPLVDGSAEYLQWIRDETSRGPEQGPEAIDG